MSSEDAASLSTVPVLKGDNYRIWARKMTAYLLGGYPDTTTKTLNTEAQG